MTPHPGAPAGLLLTGGASRRMGRDKALIEVDGVTLADRAAAVLTEVCEPVVEVGPGYTTLPAVREDPPGSGPLAALQAGWVELRRRGHKGPVLVLAVDMPSVTPGLLRWLADRPGGKTAVPHVGGYPQPMCARYAPATLDLIKDYLAGGRRSLRDLLESTEVDWITAEEWARTTGEEAFADVDTPEDLDRLGLS